MSGYFSLTFELNRSPTAISDFCYALTGAGLAFKSGFLEFKRDSFDDIIKWNQSKLDGNTQIAHTRHSRDFGQMLFDYLDFSEVRLYAMEYRQSPTFDFHLIFPEDDFFEYIQTDGRCPVHRKTEKMESIKELARKMWNTTEILAIQTAWECSDCPPKARELSERVRPQAEPFCIIADFALAEKLGLPFETIERGGALIEDKDNWNFL